MACWRQYAELVCLIDGEPATGERIGESGARYDLEIEVVWDRKPGAGDLRVLGMIDDGGIRALLPLSVDFIMAPDGSFVGEDSA
ncbi:MAG: hypothetical protein V3W41_07725 [Planctomycetota bacterium]